MSILHRVAAAVAAAALASAGLAASAVPAVAAVPAVNCTRQDPDPSALWVVVGEPDYPNDGAVQVTTSVGSVRITAEQLGWSDRRGGFGRAATSGLVNDDNCTDLVVTAESGAGEGSVYVVLGDDRGPDVKAAYRLDAPAGAGESWGTTVTLLTAPHLIAVSAPATALAPNAGGAVVLYPLSPDGSAGSPAILTQDTPGVPGASEAGDEFGAAMAALPAQNPQGLVIGAPGEAVGTRKAAGAVTLLHFTGTDLAFTAQSFTQDSVGFPTAAEVGDRFGFSVDSVWRYVAVGVPGETLGSDRGTGMVTVLDLDSATSTRPVRVRGLSQNSRGIPGNNESGDHWGFTVAFSGNNPTGCSGGGMELGVGAPFEDVGSSKDAGTVTVLAATGKCARPVLRQGAAPVGGAAEGGDYFGYSLSARPDPDAKEEDADNGWIVGVPGEDVDGKANAGYVYVLQLGWSGTSDDRRTVIAPVGGPMAEAAFGLVLGSIG